MSTTEILARDRARKERKRLERDERRLHRILRLREVEDATGRKRSAIYEGVAAGTFPAPVRLGDRAVGWLESEILDWQEQRIAERNARRKHLEA
jgi:prophage regulatory protein